MILMLFPRPKGHEPSINTYGGGVPQDPKFSKSETRGDPSRPKIFFIQNQGGSHQPKFFEVRSGPPSKFPDEGGGVPPTKNFPSPKTLTKSKFF